MKLILSKRICRKHLVPIRDVTKLKIGDLFVNVTEKNLHDCKIYILASTDMGRCTLINIVWGTRFTDPINYSCAELAHLNAGEVQIVLRKLTSISVNTFHKITL